MSKVENNEENREKLAEVVVENMELESMIGLKIQLRLDVQKKLIVIVQNFTPKLILKYILKYH